MQLDTRNVREHLRNFDFETLFLEHLFWDELRGKQAVMVGEQAYTLTRIAQKRGVQVFHLQLPTIPDRPMRQRIERAVAKQAAEHLIIFSDAAKTRQIWQWVKRAPGQPDAYREEVYHVGQNDGALTEKLKGMAHV